MLDPWSVPKDTPGFITSFLHQITLSQPRSFQPKTDHLKEKIVHTSSLVTTFYASVRHMISCI